MFEAAEAVMRHEMVMGGWRLGSGGFEAVMVVFGGSACSMASQTSGITIHSLHTGLRLSAGSGQGVRLTFEQNRPGLRRADHVTANTASSARGELGPRSTAERTSMRAS